MKKIINGNGNGNGNKWNQILNAAIKVFASKGFFNSRVSDVAKEADVAAGTIYLYFVNKDDLLISIFEEYMNQFIARLTVILEGEPDPLKKLELFINYHLEQVERYPDLAEVIQVELRQSNKFMKHYVPQKFFDYLNIISEILRDGQMKGVIREDINPDIIIRAVFGALDEIALQWVLTKKKKKYDLKNSAMELSRVFLDGLVNKENKMKEEVERLEFGVVDNQRYAIMT